MTFEHVTLSNFLIHQFSCGMFVKTIRGVYTWASDTLFEHHRLLARDMYGKTDKDLPWAVHADTLRLNDQEILDVKKSIVFNETISRRGQTIKGICHKSPYYDQRGQLLGIAGIFVDAPANKSRVFKTLSIRERQCLKNLLQGMTAFESATNLGLSRRTVEGYLEQLRLKYHCKNQAELIARIFLEM